MEITLNQITPTLIDDIANNRLPEGELSISGLEEVTNIPPEVFSALMRALAVNTSIHRLALVIVSIDDSAFLSALSPMLQTNHTIKTLVLNRNNLTNNSMHELAAVLRVNRSLLYLDIKENRLITSVQPLLSALTPVDAENSNHANTTLRELNLAWLNIAAEGAQLGELLRANSSLDSLNVSRCHLESDAIQALARGLAHNRTLRTLNLTGNSIQPAGAAYLAAVLRVNTVLEYLDMMQTEIQDAGTILLCNALQGNRDSGLRFLGLQLNDLSPHAVHAVVNMLLRNRSIEALDLSDNPFGNEPVAAKMLAYALRTNPVLSDLKLNDCQLDDKSIDNLTLSFEPACAVGMANKSVQHIDIEYNYDCSADRVDRLNRFLRANQVRREHGTPSAVPATMYSAARTITTIAAAPSGSKKNNYLNP